MGIIKASVLSKTIKSEGIVFKSIKYSETSVILDIYTLEYGLMSFIVGGVRKAKSRQAHIFHPINIIDFVAYRSDERLSRIKEAQFSFNYRSINMDVIKSSVAMFVIDLSRNAIKEKESNPELYNFIRSEMISLDELESGFALFPHLYALKLTRFLGFEPHNNFGGDNIYFDMIEGEFIDNDVRHLNIMNGPESQHMHALLSGNAQGTIDKTDRAVLLDKLVDYYKLHLEGFKPLKCLPVLRSILS